MMLRAPAPELVSCANRLKPLDRVDDREMFMKDTACSCCYEEEAVEVDR